MVLQSVLTALPSERRTPCVRGVVRMMATEQACEDYWRLAQVRREQTETDIAECFSTLRAEDIVVHAHTGGLQTYYRLSRSHWLLIEAVEGHNDRLDEHHARLLDGLDPGFGTVTA